MDRTRPDAPCPRGRLRPALRALTAAALAGALAGPPAGASSAADAAPSGRAGEAPTCLFVSSYHVGHDWTDRIEREVREALETRCRVVRFDMETKRRRDVRDIRAAAAQAHALVERLAPIVVVTADDNAAKHFVVPYLVDGPIPVVFSGVNWTVEEYGFPASNVTGIVEFAPLRPLFRAALELAPGGRRSVYVGASTLSERKNYARLVEVARTFGVTVDGVFVDSFEAWKRAFDDAQRRDFVFVGSRAGIDDWDEDAAVAHALARTVRPTLTTRTQMLPVSLVGLTKLAAEQGARAGEMARAILDGTAIADLPIVVSRDWDTWVNAALGEASGIEIPEHLLRRAQEVSP